jgi:glyoxylase-like metal-dependent hydrolase (beta-lactamase superfamily II)
VEAGIIQNPILEPLYLFHGANPIDSLRNRFVLAKPSPVHHITQPGKTNIIGVDLEIVPLPGHSLNQVGVHAEDILFCADTVFSEHVIEKYRVPVVQDVGSHIKTLNKLKESGHSLYVPSHIKPTENITGIADRNLETTQTILRDIYGILDEPKTSEQIQADLCTAYGLNLDVLQQYYLIHTTVMAYLGHLHENKQVTTELKDNNLRWRRV